MDPLTLKAAAVVGGVVLASDSRKTPPSDGRWRFPVGDWQGYLPTRSQEYRAADHHGLDIMFRRKPGGADQMWPSGFTGSGGNHGNAVFFCPDSQYVCAARDGTIWECTRSARGIQMVIDHGKPFATYYQHLSSSLFPLGIRRGTSIQVKAGQPIGIIGWDPTDARRLMHLHFEVWYQGDFTHHVDPWPLIERAPLPERIAR